MKSKDLQLTEEEQKLFNLLVSEYGVLPSASETAKIIKKSKATLYRERKNGIGINYIQDSSNATVRYPLHEIVRYLCNTNDKRLNDEL